MKDQIEFEAAGSAAIAQFLLFYQIYDEVLRVNLTSTRFSLMRSLSDWRESIQFLSNSEQIYIFFTSARGLSRSQLQKREEQIFDRGGACDAIARSIAAKALSASRGRQALISRFD